jgi:hypothetical protein
MIDPELSKKQVLLQILTNEELVKLFGFIIKMSFKKGEHLFKEKEEVRGLYLIQSGKVETFKVTPEGWKQTLAVLTPGQFLGGITIFETKQHEASAIAVEDSDLLLLPKEEFERLIEDEIDCVVNTAKFFLEFTQAGSCGKCTPCRIGTKRMLEIFDRITSGNGSEGDIELLEELGYYIRETSLCELGVNAPNYAISTIKFYRNVYETHIRDKKCPAGICKI